MKKGEKVSNSKLLALVAACAIAALGVAACGGGDDDDGGDQGAAVTITSPQDGATEGGTVTANVELRNFQLDPADVGKMNVEGKGHLHFSLDGGKYDNSKYSGPNGKLAEQLGTDGQYSPATAPTITYRDLPPGEHTLKVELVDNDHSPTGVSDSVTFTVESTMASTAPGAVEVGDFFFAPASERVSAGDTVRWENTGSQLHTVKGPGFASQAFGGGESYEFRFDRAGTYDYLCTLHPTQMKGTIVVE